jgi:peptide/nickel transport system substrate-binding protein
VLRSLRSRFRLVVRFAVLGGITQIVAAGGAFVPTSAQASPTNAEAVSSARQSGQLVISDLTADPLAIDPHTPLGADVNAVKLRALVYDTLTTIDDRQNVAPSLATSWRILPSRQLPNKIWVFNIRKGVRFSNGRQMTAADVVGSLNRLVDPKSQAFLATRIAPVRSVTQSGPWQVKVTLKTPDPGLPAELSRAGLVLPIAELNAGRFDPSKEMLGTGPFRIVSRVAGESWRLQKNTYYWRKGLPRASGVVENIISNASAQIAALRSGSTTVATFTNPAVVPLLRGVPNVKTAVQRTNDVFYLVANALSSVFADPRLRHAISLGIDRNQIIKLGLAGVGQPTAAVPASFGICDPASMPYAKPNVQEARRLVAAAGAAGKDVTIDVLGNDPPAVAVAQVIQQQLRAIGLDARVQQIGSADVRSRVISNPSRFDLYVSWHAGGADPASVLPNWTPLTGTFFKGHLLPDQTLMRNIVRSRVTSARRAREQVLRATCRRVALLGNKIPLVARSVVIGYRADRIAPLIQPVEGYSVALRHLPEFRLVR